MRIPAGKCEYQQGCDNTEIYARGLCLDHYGVEYRANRLHLYKLLIHRKPIPLVCECDEPEADPRVNAGECRKCHRKPVALMRRATDDSSTHRS